MSETPPIRVLSKRAMEGLSMTTTRKQPPLVKSEHSKTWHIDDGTAPDGSERKKSPPIGGRP